MPGKWSDDAFLDSLRRLGDPVADAAIARMMAEGQTGDVGSIFRMMRANDDVLPAGAPQAYKDFAAASPPMPPDLDFARLQRGGDAFYRNALPAVIAMLASSLPRGYAAPAIGEILSISRDLERHPYSRLMGVVQLLINISDGDAFQPQGRARVTAQKLRLLHAGVRAIVSRYRPDYRKTYGVPVNLEDMLATIMGFSYLVVDGVEKLGVPFTRQEAEDNYYLWRTFALMVGIHPPGLPYDWSYVPETLDDAAEFYASFARRHDVPAARNPYGVLLTQDNLQMMRHMIAAPMALIGMRLAPRIWMAEMMTVEQQALVGVQPLVGHAVIRAILARILAVGRSIGHRWVFAVLARDILQGMVDLNRGGEATFSIPFDRLGLRGKDFT
jgi:hypothetical protein